MVRVRFAPSPTGLLHIGGLRTALYNYLFARQNGGKFILRIEDTDRTRFVENAEADILEGLRWAGIEIDEGPEAGGEVGPYRQSERGDIYMEHAKILMDQGKAYVAFDTPEELEALRNESSSEGVVTKYDSTTRGRMKNSISLSQSEVDALLAEGVPHVIRLKIPEDLVIKIQDRSRGEVEFHSSTIDDQVLIKSDGMPTYHLAVVVDDHHMGITHVVRGVEWLPSTPKHFFMFEAFGWDPPEVAHLPLILSPSGGKLSKRKAEKAGIPVFVHEYQSTGYEPEALVNFLLFLGWNPGTEQELFDMSQMTKDFSLERIGSSGMQFDLAKLSWYNQQHIKLKPGDVLATQFEKAFLESGFKPEGRDMQAIAGLLAERVEFVKEGPELGSFFFNRPDSYPEDLLAKVKPDSLVLVKVLADRISNVDPFEASGLKELIKEICAEHDQKMGSVMFPARLGVTGASAGPDLLPSMVILGAEECAERLRFLLTQLSG